jgi:hypothetical protein
MLTERGTIHGWYNVTCGCNQTVNTKYLCSDEKITSCGGKDKTPANASVIARKALMLADSSQEKLLNSINCQVLLSCFVFGSYGLFVNLPL